MGRIASERRPGYHAFAHDHQGKFPMQLNSPAGGSLELSTQKGGPALEFSSAARHFQALAADLVTPKIVHCPADTRSIAPSFPALTESHLSYFVGLNADFAQPNSLLAGDRNLTNDWLSPAPIVAFGPTNYLRWTHELHRFKGNLLFADGRVEQANNVSLRPLNPAQPSAQLNLPAPPPNPDAAKQGKTPPENASPLKEAPQDPSTSMPASPPLVALLPLTMVYLDASITFTNRETTSPPVATNSPTELTNRIKGTNLPPQPAPERHRWMGTSYTKWLEWILALLLVAALLEWRRRIRPRKKGRAP